MTPHPRRRPAVAALVVLVTTALLAGCSGETQEDEESASPEDLQANPPADAGAGAFTFSEYKRGQSATVVKKDDWWGGPVCLDDLTINFGTNAAVSDYRAYVETQLDRTLPRIEMERPAASAVGGQSMH